jgi:hypothetical protein
MKAKDKPRISVIRNKFMRQIAKYAWEDYNMNRDKFDGTED